MKTPYQCTIEAFGGVRPLSRRLKCGAGTVSKWQHRPSGGIPDRWHKKILIAARKDGAKLRDGRPLNAEMLVLGAM